MAVTKILAKSMRLDKLVNYVANGDKTESGILVTTRGCRIESAAQQMMDTKERWGKTDGVQAYHIIQSFKPGEITPELAHELGCRLADEFLPGYEVCIGTHTDKEHIHNHIVFNSVSLATGKKYTNTRTDYYKGIRRISDALCAEYGLSLVMETGGKGLSYAEWKLKQAGLLSNKELLMQDVADSLSVRLDELTKTRIILNSKKKSRRSLYDAAAALEYLSDVPALYEAGASGVGEDYAAYKAASAALQGENVPALRAEKASLYTRIADVNAEMREVRKQLRLCEAVKTDAPDMERRLTDESGKRMTEIERDDR